MPIYIDGDRTWSMDEFQYMDQGNLSLATAKLVAGDLRDDGHLAEILSMLDSSRISREVLQNSRIVDALARYQYDEEIGRCIKKILLRLLRISLGKEDALNQEIDKIFRFNERGYLTREEQDNLLSDAVQKRLRNRNFQLMAAEEGTSKKRKMTEIDERPSKYRKIDSGDDSSSRKPVSAPKSPFVFPSYTMRTYDDELKKSRDILISEEIEFSPSLKLALKLSLLPSRPSSEDVDPLLKGLKARDLQEAEQILGREMNRTDPLWWGLLFRDFGRQKKKWSCTIRENYRRTAEIEELKERNKYYM